MKKSLNKWLSKVLVLAATAVLMYSCTLTPEGDSPFAGNGADIQSYPQNVDGKTTLSGLRNTVYMGGSAIYNPDDSELNQLSAAMTIPVRLGEVEKVLDPASKQMCFKNVESKALYGFITIQEIDTTRVKFYYRLYRNDGNIVFSGNSEIKTNGSQDLNGDNVQDLSYIKMQSARPGFENAYELKFISSQLTKKTAMFSMMPEYFTSKAYPSGIIGLNPNGKLVIQNMGNATGSPVSGQSRVAYRMNKASHLVLMPEDFVMDKVMGKYGKVAAASSKLKASSQSQELAVDYAEDITIADALPLVHFRVSNNNSAADTRSPSRSFGSAWDELTGLWSIVDKYHTLDLVDESPWSFTHQGSDSANKISLGFNKFKLGIGVIMDGDISWDSIWVELKGGVYYQMGIGLSGKGSFSYNIYDKVIGEFTKDIVAGPVLITFTVPVSIGADLDIGAAFHLNYGFEAAGFMGYGVKAGAKVDWDWWDTDIDIYCNTESINEHIMRFIGTPEFNGTAWIALRPYIGSGLKISLWKAFWADGKLKAFVGPKIKAELTKSILTVKGQFEVGVKFSGQAGIGMKLLGKYRGWTWDLINKETSWPIGGEKLIYTAKYWDTATYSQGTPAPYNNGSTMTYTFSRPGAKKMMLHYDQFITEKDYDFVYVYDKYGNLVDKSSGSKSGSYSPIVYCDAIILRVVTDGSVNTVDGKNCQVHVDQILYLC